MVARFPAGTFARIETVLAEAEDRTDFVRAAVNRELARREKKRSRLRAGGRRSHQDRKSDDSVNV
jgi:hypothetical protein